MNCEYVKNSMEPCKDCPRVIQALHMCGILKETLDELKEPLKN